MSVYADIPLIERVSQMLTDALGDDFDPDAFWETLDGETDALDIADRIILQMQNDKALAEAAKAQADALAARAKRIGEREKAHKSALLAILDASGQKKLERPCATVSRRAGSLSVQIVNPDDIPSQLRTVKTTETPDKAAIRKSIEAGEKVPGAELVRGADTVTVRVS